MVRVPLAGRVTDEWLRRYQRLARGTGVPVRDLAQDRPVRRVPGRGRHALAFEVLNRTASAHFIESIPIAGTAETGAADPAGASPAIWGCTSCHEHEPRVRNGPRLALF